jgi:phage tail sheath protein FI
MAAPVQYKTPGVYIVEKDAFPNTVVEVATAIPAFIGYTETAANGPVPLAGKPTYIGSLADFQRLFGNAPVPAYTLTLSADGTSALPTLAPETRFFLYHSVALYFLNGGGPAYVVSVGSFEDVAAVGRTADDFMSANPSRPGQASPLDSLKKVPDVTLIVAPDTTLLDSPGDCYNFWQQALSHCNYMKSRMALIDIYGGDQARTHDPATDVISADTIGFRDAIGTDFLNYGAAYYPWLNFDVVSENSITFDSLDDDGRTKLVGLLEQELAAMTPAPSQTMRAKITALHSQVAQKIDPDPVPLPSPLPPGTELRANKVLRLHAQLRQVSPVYKRLIGDMLALANLLPPAAAMAGVYARTDANDGVWQVPANTSIASAVSPVVDISQEDQEDLNMPLDGKAVNAIRAITGRGLVVWGARTLDGNSQDWRYINVRRTLIMLEQSTKAAMMPYVFAPNVATTWVTVQNMIVNFLINIWKAGGLAGAKAQDAFSVSVGLGVTMTGDDVLDGYMRIAISVAMVHPAEFIELTFQQQMQVS